LACDKFAVFLTFVKLQKVESCGYNHKCRQKNNSAEDDSYAVIVEYSPVDAVTVTVASHYPSPLIIPRES
jgi:hypothetical protein